MTANISQNTLVNYTKRYTIPKILTQNSTADIPDQLFRVYQSRLCSKCTDFRSQSFERGSVLRDMYSVCLDGVDGGMRNSDPVTSNMFS